MEDEYRLRDRLRNIAVELAELVTAEELDRYRTPEDINLESYLTLRDRLISFAKERGVVYAYYLRPRDDRFFQYIIDNDLEPETHVGLETELSPYEHEVGVKDALGGEVVAGIIDAHRVGPWRGLVSAYAPIRDAGGRVVAAAGVDYSVEPFTAARRQLALLTGLQVLVALLVTASGILAILWYRSQVRAAREANQAKSVFLARIGHEIRTPMNAIVGITELLGRLADQLPAVARTYVSNIRQAGGNLLSIINDLLDLSKIESGKFEVLEAPYRLSLVVSDIINIAGVWLMEKTVRLEVSVAAGIPDRLVGDATRVRQVVLNLVSNAVKYTDNGHISLEVCFTPADTDDRLTLRVRVSDTGIGIRAEDLGGLFQEFVRFDKRAHLRTQGTGLGLAIVRNLCQLMGGDVSVVSTHGSGSVFTAEFPQGIDDPAPMAEVADRESKSVLLYERRPLFARSCEAALGDLGVAYLTVASEEEFTEALMSGGHTHVILPVSVYPGLPGAARERLSSLATAVITEDLRTFQAESVWYLYLPLYAKTLADFLNGAPSSAAEPAQPGLAEGAFVAPKARVLIVDDLRTNLMVMEGLLDPYDLQVEVCLSGTEAVELVKSRAYDLVFMDHMMAGLDGLETARLIRAMDGERFRTVPIVAMTANVESGSSDFYLGGGMSDYLPKPIETHRLNSILLKWLPLDKIERRVQ